MLAVLARVLEYFDERGCFFLVLLVFSFKSDMFKMEEDVKGKWDNLQFDALFSVIFETYPDVRFLIDFII